MENFTQKCTNDDLWPLFDRVEIYKKSSSEKFIVYHVFLLEKIIFACNQLVNLKFSRL